MFEEIDELYKQAQKRRSDIMTQYNKDLTEAEKAIVKLRIERQKHCKHPSTREEDDFNYHNNTEWTTTYCTVCDKQLGKR